MLTVLHIAYRILFWLLIGLGLAFVLLLVRLSGGPVDLVWLKPQLEQALTPENDDVTVTSERIELRLDEERRTFRLVGVDVRYQGREGSDSKQAPFLVFPEVGLSLSVEALLKRGVLVASSVHAEAPSLVVTRSEEGVIGLRPDVEGDSEGLDLTGLLHLFMQPPRTDSRFAFLKTVQISGGRVAFYDHTRAQALTTKDADLKLTRRQDGGGDVWLRADILQPSAHPASVQLSATIASGSDKLPFVVDIAGLMPADLPALWPLEAPAVPTELAGMRLPVQATVKGDMRPDGGISVLMVDLHMADGILDLPGHLAEPLEIESADFKGVIDGDFSSIELEKASIISRGARLDASGRAIWTGDRPTVSLEFEASNVRAEDLPAFWPPDLGDDAREWVVENITAGRVSRGEARLDLKPDDFGPEPLRDDAVDGTFDFEGLSVRYLDEMPPIEGASGKAAFDADRMEFDVAGGTNEGVALSSGTVVITGMGKPGRQATQLRVLANAEGSMEHMLTLLDHPPLDVAKELEIDPATTAGRGAAKIEVRLPLHNEVTEEEAVVLAEATLADLVIERLPKLKDDVRLDQGSFAVTVDEDSVRLDGNAAVLGIPLAIEIVEPLEEDEASTRRIDLAGRLNRDQLEAVGVSVDGLEGELDFKATVSETGTQFWIDLEADLKPLAITPPSLAWEKSLGQEGLLRASMVMPIDGPIDVKHFNLTAGDLTASGSMVLSNGGLQSLLVDGFSLADSDAVLRYAPDGNGGYDVIIEASRLDLDALLGDGQRDGGTFKSFHVVLRADRLKARGIELVDVQADAVHSAEGWRTASAIGTLPAGGKFALELSPEGGGDDRRLEVRSDNAGALIEALDLGQRVEGGQLLLSTRLEAQDPVIADGRFEITEFVLQDAPLLARMLTLASLNGIGNLLGGTGIQMDHLILPFAYQDRKLTFTEGLIRGSELGLTIEGDVALDEKNVDLAGTIIPIYTLNRLLGQVPVLGRILTGVDGRGAFAATYTIQGPNDKPTVFVNPLSILTPGLIRDFFGGLFNGTLEPPEVRETDD